MPIGLVSKLEYYVALLCKSRWWLIFYGAIREIYVKVFWTVGIYSKLGPATFFFPPSFSRFEKGKKMEGTYFPHFTFFSEDNERTTQQFNNIGQVKNHHSRIPKPIPNLFIFLVFSTFFKARKEEDVIGKCCCCFTLDLALAMAAPVWMGIMRMLLDLLASLLLFLLVVVM